MFTPTGGTVTLFITWKEQIAVCGMRLANTRSRRKTFTKKALQEAHEVFEKGDFTVESAHSANIRGMSVLVPDLPLIRQRLEEYLPLE